MTCHLAVYRVVGGADYSKAASSLYRSQAILLRGSPSCGAMYLGTVDKDGSEPAELKATSNGREDRRTVLELNSP